MGALINPTFIYRKTTNAGRKNILTQSSLLKKEKVLWTYHSQFEYGV